uniref:HAT C-terminal dimerisation domain-containing protein n=1 Tax=Glossina austeni TaxID=7395 RepID=A0A1A9UKT1_GLOAU
MLLSILNKSMQGDQIHAFTQKHKITAFMKKLELWIISLKKNNFDIFPTFKITCLADEIEESKVLINNRLTSLWKQFSLYFKDLDMSKYEWIRNPFVVEKYYYFGLTTAEQEMIIDLSSDSTLKQMFRDENNIVTLWLRVKNDFPTLTNKALEILLPFVTSYLCETVTVQ